MSDIKPGMMIRYCNESFPRAGLGLFHLKNRTFTDIRRHTRDADVSERFLVIDIIEHSASDLPHGIYFLVLDERGILSGSTTFNKTNVSRIQVIT